MRCATVIALLVLLMLPVGIAYADAPTTPELYEYINTGGDGNSSAIQGANETAQVYESDSESHTITSIRVSLQRVGSPRYVTLELQTATGSKLPSGVVLGTATIADTNIPVGSYSDIVFDLSSQALYSVGSTDYCIVVSAPYGNATNYVLWEMDTGGDGDADSEGSHTTDAGACWVSDSPTDYLFEVYGRKTLKLNDVKVVGGYHEDGDWLFLIDYENYYTPYYPEANPATWFNLQLLDSSNNTLAQTNLRKWGHRPGSIYLNAKSAAKLEWCGAYTVRMAGNFGTNPYVEYTLAETDWLADSDLDMLDDWVLSVAETIGKEEGTLLITFIAEHGAVLNDTGQAIFAIGIPGLATIRPELMECAFMSVAPDDKTFDLVEYDIGTGVGSEVKGILKSGGEIIGVANERTMGGLVVAGISIVLIAIGAIAGHIYVGVGLAYVGLIVGYVLGLIEPALFGVVTFAGVVVWVVAWWSSK